MLRKINEDILAMPDERRELVSDGYHTFKELYEHRVALFVALCNMMWERNESHNSDYHCTMRYEKEEFPWKSKLHSDGTMFEGWFIAGIGMEKGETLTYHLPIYQWDELSAIEIPNAPEWDGHTSDDVVKLLYKIQ